MKMKRITFSLLLGILLTAIIAAPVLAGYYASLTVTEANGNAYTQVGLIEDVDVTYLADNGYISLTGLDTRVTSGGTAIPHLMVDDSILFSTPLAAYETRNLQFTTGNAALTDYYVVVGDGGYVTISDHANLEPGNDFEIEFDGYIDTSLSDDDIYPIVMTAATSTEDSLVTSHDVTLPSGIVIGDLLLMLFSCYRNAAGNPVITWDTGWTELDVYDTGQYSAGVAYRVATGSEGSTATITTAAAGYSAHQTFRVIDYQGTPEITAEAPGNSANPDSGSLAPTWGSSHTLWFSIFGSRQNASRTVSSYPANYLYGQYTESGAGYAQAGSARREVTAASEDPGQYVLSDDAAWAAWTVGVQGVGDSLISKGDDFGIYINGDGDVAARISGSSPRAVVASVSSGGCIVNVWADTTDFGIDIDASTEDSVALGGVSVTDNANGWVIVEIPYYDYYSHTTSSTLRIDYDPDSIISGTTLPNEDDPGTYDGTITWGSNPGGVTVTLGGLISDEQLFPAGSGANFPVPQDIAGPSGQPGMTSDVGTLTTNPLYPLVSMISDTTSLPVGIVWVMGATFILALLFVWMIGDQQMMHQMFIGIAGGGWVAFCWHLGIYPFWVIFIYAVLAIAIVIGERSPTIS